MKKLKNIEKLKALAADNTSEWEREAMQRQAEDGWRTKSAAIALQLLRRLRAQKMSQKALAEKLAVSPQYINKIVKGNENLSLETIAKLEKALGISLITIYLGEKPVVGTGPRQPLVAVDYYRGNSGKPERVYDRYAHFSLDTNHFSA